MTDLLSQAKTACCLRATTALELLRPWVVQNSYSRNIAGVNAVGDLLQGDFSLPELSCERRKGNGVGDHLAFRTEAWGSAPECERVVLVGHHDTVFPPGAFDVWEVDGDVLRGPGVLDMKGGLLTIHMALHSLSTMGILATIPVAMVSVGDEEIGSPDSQSFLCELAAGAGAGLVFEAGRKEDAIITQRKGTAGFEVAVKGKAAHAGNHHREGKNAIRALARFVDRVENFTDYAEGLTVNVGTITGGHSRNTVPDFAECQIDCRYVEPRKGERLVGQIKELASAIAVDTGCEFVLDGGIRRPPLVRNEASQGLYARYAKAASAVGLGSGEASLIGGGSDANTLSAIGVPSIDGLGPRGAGFHTQDEYIEVSSLVLRAQALAHFLIEWQRRRTKA